MSIEELVKKYVDATPSLFRVHQRLRAALTEQAETHALELRAYEATVQNLEQRIKDLQLEMLANGEAQRVPEGWRLVPIYPTSDMLSAFDHCDAQGCQFAETYWDAMLAAATKKEGE